MFLREISKTGSFKLLSTSSISIVDRNAPFSRWVEKVVQRAIKDSVNKQLQFSLPMYCDDTDEERDTYPFAEFLWTPQVSNGVLVSGILMARKVPWTEADCTKAVRMSDLYLHAQAAIKGQKELTRTRLSIKPVMATLCVLAVVLGFVPISITALAPVEVVPKKPFVLAAPFDGVVKEITATQGEALSPGDTVIIFDDVHLLNNKKLADQRAAIAQARYQRASQGAIGDHRVKREIEVNKAE